MGEVVVLPVVRIEREQDRSALAALLDMMPTGGRVTADWLLDELHRRGFEIVPLYPVDGA